MPRYKINGQLYDFATEPSEADIDEVAKSNIPTVTNPPSDVSVASNGRTVSPSQNIIDATKPGALALETAKKTGGYVLGRAGGLLKGVGESIHHPIKSAIDTAKLAGGVIQLIPGSPIGTLLNKLPGADERARIAAETGRSMIEHPVDTATDFALTAGAGELAGGLMRKGRVIASNAADQSFRGGLTKPIAKAMETKYKTNTGNLLGEAQSQLEQKGLVAEKSYSKSVNNFKENQIKATNLQKTLKKDLVEKGWLDKQGNPTEQYKSGVGGDADLRNDRLTKIYLDTKKHGNLITKSDFSRFNENLKGIGWDNPSVQMTRDALYNDAEKSGMTGIKKARDLMHEHFQISNKFINQASGELKNISESMLNRVGSDIPVRDMARIKELSDYLDNPIATTAEKINKLNQAKDLIKRIKTYGKAAGLGILGWKGGGILKSVVTGGHK